MIVPTPPPPPPPPPTHTHTHTHTNTHSPHLLISQLPHRQTVMWTSPQIFIPSSNAALHSKVSQLSVAASRPHKLASVLICCYTIQVQPLRKSRVKTTGSRYIIPPHSRQLRHASVLSLSSWQQPRPQMTTQRWRFPLVLCYMQSQ